MIILSSILFLVIYLSLIALSVYIMSRIRRSFIVNKYKNILALFNHFLKLTYDWIYTDQILGYTASGTVSIPEDEMETIERNFIKLMLDTMGSNNEKIFIEFYGSRITLINNMLMYIRDQIANDQISKVISTKQKEANNT